MEITLIHSGLQPSADLSRSICSGSRLVLKAPTGLLSPLAPSIGLVQYERFQMIHRLHQATLRGADGVWYAMGQN